MAEQRNVSENTGADSRSARPGAEGSPSKDLDWMQDLPLDILRRHAGRGPRYTSYPPATAWHDQIGPADLHAALAHASDQAKLGNGKPLSVYAHVPFCPSQCYFCACNVLITPRTDLADAYLDRVDKELDLLAPHLPEVPTTQMHWGGGSPSYLTPAQMRRLLTAIGRKFHFSADAEIALEADPRILTFEHLQELREIGFNRLSMGGQDFDPAVQEAVHRDQSFELTAGFVQQARKVGFSGVNLDFIYGLPKQTLESFARTLQQVLEIRPDRIALYGYAHVPWLKPMQRRFDAESLPDPAMRFKLFQMALQTLSGAGYEFIGMDHFALPDDELAKARRNGTLQRNFMGYTTAAGTDLVGVGLTSISYIGDLFAQNERKLNPYYGAVDSGVLPATRGLRLTAEDQLRSDVIQSLMCNGIVDKAAVERKHGIDFDAHFAKSLQLLQPLAADGLIDLGPDRLTVSDLGRILVRPLAMCFDAWLPAEMSGMQRFSATV